MSLTRRTRRQVLRDKSGLSTSIPEAIGGISLKMILLTAMGGTLTVLLGFWAISTASADTSSGFQNTNIGFEKAVHASDVVVGQGTNKVGLLKDTSDGRCEVQTWQNTTRDGKIALQVDTKVVSGTCSPTTPLLAPSSSTDTQELLFNIKQPELSYANLGGRTITFNAAGTPTLATGVKPAGVKQGDWDDVRPYKAQLKLQTLDADASTVTQKATATGYTNVQNVTAAADELRYVPGPSTDPIPGPLTITDVKRSSSVGTAYAGAREGIAVTFAGAVCEAMPTKVTVSYTQQGPSAAPAVSTVLNPVLTGDSTTVDLGSVPNGSTGSVDVAAKCVDNGVPVKDARTYTQPIPATTLTVKQNAAAEKHDLSWVKVSSLPTQFELRRSFDGTTDGAPFATTDQLAYQSVYQPGENLGMTSTYAVVAVVDSNKSPEATASITTPLPKPEPTVVTGDGGGASWTAVTCPAYSNAQYAEHHYRQVGMSTAVSWSAMSAWSPDRSLTKVVTPGYGRTVYEVQARCVATKSDAVSPVSTSNTESYYQPEEIKLAAARSTTIGTQLAGVREGVNVLQSGARCWNNTPSEVHVAWTGPTSSTQEQANTGVLTAGTTSYNFAKAENGGEGEAESWASCSGVNSGSAQNLTTFTNEVPDPTLTVKQGVDAEQHILTWNKVSSLPTTFQVSKKAAVGTQNALPPATTALTQTLNYTDGTNYGNKTDYIVTATVNDLDAASPAKSITTAWPEAPSATGIKYARTSTGDFVDGRITWGWSGSCPAGTTTQGRLLENRTGSSDGSISTTTRKTTGWSARPTGYTWAPDYAREGYAYGARVDGKCVSNVTDLESPIESTQSSNWVVPMSQPKAPVWDAYNYRDHVRNTNWTYSTGLTGPASMTVDYKTYCVSGSKLNWSSFTSTSWEGNEFYHPFGYDDNWKLPDGVDKANVLYHDQFYTCSTPWTTSPKSAQGANKWLEVRR